MIGRRPLLAVGTAVLAVVAAASLPGCGDGLDEEQDARRREELYAVLAESLPGVTVDSLDCATERLISLEPAVVDGALAGTVDREADEVTAAPLEARLAVRTAVAACLTAEELAELG